MFGTLSLCGLVLVAGSVAQMPKEPDFSGEWELVIPSGPPSDQASILTVRQTITRTTVRGEPMVPWFSDITVQRQFSTRIVSESYKIGMIGGTVGGVPAGASSPQGEWTTFSVNGRARA